MIHSDWHIHSCYSYDAQTSLEEIVSGARAQGLKYVGITDHANRNDDKFLSDLYASAENVKKMQKDAPELVLGVEFTPIPKPHFDYMAKTRTYEGFTPPIQSTPYDIELAVTKDELIELGVRYAICASHARVDSLDTDKTKLTECINEWFRQQMWMAQDERTTILGHPWYIGNGLWYEDFSVIPYSMQDELLSALKQNGKIMECNFCMLQGRNQTEKFRHQYAEFLRDAFERGIRITYGSDCHGKQEGKYPDMRPQLYPYLEGAGFVDGDFYTLTENDLW